RQCMEFFHLFGDPTYQPYITVPEQMFIEPEEQSVAAGKTLRVHTAPEAVVCISKERRVVAVAMADKQGDAVLYLPADAPVGMCVLYSSAPFYNDLESSILITEGNGEKAKRPEKPSLPEVEYADMIDTESAATVLMGNNYFPSSQPEAFSVESDAEYVLWAATNLEPGTNGTQYAHWLHRDDDVRRGLYLRNKYPQCALITTESAGAVAYVSIDWLHTCGKTEVLGVYGSKDPYTQTTQAWNGQQGTYLGELRKEQNDYLLIEDEWPYILLRAENHENFVKDQNNVFFKSLTIGWNKKEGISTDVTSVATYSNTDHTYYDLQGRRMQTPRTGGIYIMNGRKVLR
ncbi:MAG: hypothetical protein MJZ40_03160, partial [Bacteroidaceae bacterium]|nr:hypothetical protein [Bacteroidaceae bacterium]